MGRIARSEPAVSILLTPVRIGALRLPNRLVRSATSDGLATPEGYVSEEQIELYKALASGGAGLIVTGNAFIDPLGRSELAMLAADRDTCVPGLARLASTVHERGNRVLLQIQHAGRQTNRTFIGGQRPVGPSELPWKGEKGPRAMTCEEIAGATGSFVAAARRAGDAGYDGVQLHAAHGYLLHQFLSPYTNLRTDQYGGGTAGRARFVVEVVRGIRRELGASFVVGAKINGDDLIPQGLTPDVAAHVARLLVEAGADWLEVSGGILYGWPELVVRRHIKIPGGEAYFRLPTSVVSRAVAPVPVAMVGGLRSLRVMEEVLAGGECDLIALSRPFIYEPDFGHRLAAGAQRARCISCNLCALRLNQEGLACPVRDAPNVRRLQH